MIAIVTGVKRGPQRLLDAGTIIGMNRVPQLVHRRSGVRRQTEMSCSVLRPDEGTGSWIEVECPELRDFDRQCQPLLAFAQRGFGGTSGAPRLCIGDFPRDGGIETGEIVLEDVV